MLATIYLVTKPFSWIVVGTTIVMLITVLYNFINYIVTLSYYGY